MLYNVIEAIIKATRGKCMKSLYMFIVLTALLVPPLLAFAASEQWCYAQNHNSIHMVQTDQLVVFFEGFSPEDFYAHSHPYTITEVEFYVYGWDTTGSALTNLKVYLIPDKLTPPDGLTPYQTIEGLTFNWAKGGETLNSYPLNWEGFSGGQCVGIAVEFPDGMYHDPYLEFGMVGDAWVSQDTGDWCYAQMYGDGGWYTADHDFSIVVTVSFDNTSITSSSLGKIKALLE
jgi:hypothetical protein